MDKFTILTTNGDLIVFKNVELVTIPTEDDNTIHFLSEGELVTVYTDNIIYKSISLGNKELEAMLMMSEMSKAVKSLELSNVMKDANDLFSELAGEDTTLRDLIDKMNKFTEDLGGNK